jgi:hypothetical protein
VTTTVVNLKGHRDDPEFADVEYVGRAMHRGGWHLAASPLASPFRPGPDGSRAEVVARYREYLLARPDLLALLPGLRGRRLGCWCVPEPCHAQVIAELADAAGGLPAAPLILAGPAHQRPGAALLSPPAGP